MSLYRLYDNICKQFIPMDDKQTKIWHRSKHIINEDTQ